MALPTDKQARKDIPVYSGFVKYFPDAMAAVAQLSKIANEQHNPGEPLHWAKGKSMDHLDALMRHMLDELSELPRDEDGVLHAVKEAWRAMAHLQTLADNGVNIFAELPKVAEPLPAHAPVSCPVLGCDCGACDIHRRLQSEALSKR